MRGKARITPFLILRILRTPATLGLLFTVLAGAAGWLQPVDRFVQDLRALITRHEVSSDLVIIEIDASSLQRLESWPWPRRLHARLLDQLRDTGAVSIFYDVDFSAASNDHDDRSLAEAVAKYPHEKIMLPAFTQRANSVEGEALIPTLPLPELREHAALASVNIRPDSDGLVRTITAMTQIGNETAILAGIRMSRSDGYRRRAVPIDYSIDPGSFHRLSFADVVEGKFDPGSLKNRHVIVGATAIELGDMLPVPVYRSLPGVVVQALAYQSLQEGGLRPASRGLTIATTLLMLVLMYAVFRHGHWRGGLVFVVGGLLAMLGLTVYAYDQWRTLVSVAPQMSLLTSGYAFFLFARLEQQHINLLVQAFDLHRKDTLMANVVDNSIDGILTVSDRGIITSANPAACRLFDSADHELDGRDIREFLTDLSNPAQDGDLSEALINEAYVSCEQRARRLDGGEFPVEIASSRMKIDDEVIYNVFIRDITERKRHHDTLQHQATHDALTGLGNRYFLDHRLLELAAPDDTSDSAPVFALLLIDLDRFKEVNDALGHGVGDRLLTQVAQRFVDCTNDEMALARIGGDEFAILMKDMPGARHSRELAERLLGTLEEPFPVNDMALEIGASIGIALYPGDTEDPALLMKYADSAMYVAKRAGTGMAFHRPEFARRHAERIAVSTELRQAIAHNRLCLCYQPKLDLTDRTVTGAEALLRWKHPGLGDIGPEEIVDVAENVGLIWPLTEWTLKTALDNACAWHREGYPLQVAVNLSARLLQDRTLVDKVTSCIAHSELSPNWLTLEVTESAIMADPAAAMKNATALHAAGIRLSIDDFGTGYSSLAYLRHLPASELKIDKSFVTDMSRQDKNALIVKSTVELSHNLGLKVVAEGVESEEILIALRALGCDVAQGYHISRPLSAGEMGAWLAANGTRRWTALPPAGETGS